MKHNYKTLSTFLAVTLGGGLVIGFLTRPGDWYSTLNRPWFNPPSWVFSPVWTILYCAIAVSGWMIWTQNKKSFAMKLWFLALGLNFLWSPIFFGLQNIALALVVIIALLLSLVAFILAAKSINKTAALLFVPYALWISYASVLNAALYSLN
jgi:translocator protein